MLWQLDTIVTILLTILEEIGALYIGWGTRMV